MQPLARKSKAHLLMSLQIIVPEDNKSNQMAFGGPDQRGLDKYLLAQRLHRFDSCMRLRLPGFHQPNLAGPSSEDNLPVIARREGAIHLDFEPGRFQARIPPLALKFGWKEVHRR